MGELKRMSTRALELQCAAIDEFRRAPVRDIAEKGLWEELLKTLRSLSDNSAESDGTSSRADFISKFHICLKEAREALQLLRVLLHATPARARQLGALERSCDAIVAILVSSLKTAKANQTAEDARKRRNKRPQTE